MGIIGIHGGVNANALDREREREQTLAGGNSEAMSGPK